MADDEKTPPPRKDKHLDVRIDADLYEKAKERARPFGGLSAVIRAMLRLFAQGERNFDIEDVARENERAPKKPRKKRRKK